MKHIFLILGITASVSIARAQTATPFADVPQNHWAASAIAKLAAAGIVIGYPADEAPTRTISSAPRKVGKTFGASAPTKAKSSIKKYARKTR